MSLFVGIKERVSGFLDAAADRVDWGRFARLLGAGLFGVATVIPYQLSLLEQQQQVDIPTSVLVIAIFVQTGILVGIAVFVGLLLKDRVGLSVFNPRESVRTASGLVSNYGLAVVFGAVAAGVVVVLDSLVFGPLIQIEAFDTLASSAESPPLWTAFLASFYGGITEEILIRLGVMTFVVWVLSKISRTDEGLPTRNTIWAGIVITAVVFGLGHLPTTAAIIGLTPTIVARAIILNGIPGIVFGYLYWKRDLTAAMVAHFSADIVLHVITPWLT